MNDTPLAARIAVWLLALGTAAACGSAPEPVTDAPPAAPSGVALELEVELIAPVAPVTLGGARHLVYELTLAWDGADPLTLERLRVDAPPLAQQDLDARALRGMALISGQGHPPPAEVTLPPGGRGVLYLWLTVPEGSPVPARIAHTLTARGPAGLRERRLEVSAAATPPRVFRPPLAGAGWFSANAPQPTSPHRRSVMMINERLWLAQRYAIDFVRVRGAEGTHTGDPADNTSYHAYGAPVLAMAEGTVIEVIDGIPENVPGPTSRAVAMSLETLAGNAVVVDHGGGYFATYAHLVPGRIPVAGGRRLAAGDVLGYVGNSGNSTEPHLHLHVCDGPSRFTCQGVPYAFDRFEEAVVTLHPDRPPVTRPPVTREAALPEDRALLTFAEPREDAAAAARPPWPR